MPAPRLRPTGPSTITDPPVMYSPPWSPTPSTTAVAPELRTANHSPAPAGQKSLPTAAPPPPRAAPAAAGGPRVADRQPLPGPAGAEQLAPGRPVESRVADQDRGAGVVVGRADDDPAAAHALADIVVAGAGQPKVDPRGQERPEALPGRALELDPGPAGRRPPPERPAHGHPDAGPASTV